MGLPFLCLESEIFALFSSREFKKQYLPVITKWKRLTNICQNRKHCILYYGKSSFHWSLHLEFWITLCRGAGTNGNLFVLTSTNVVQYEIPRSGVGWASEMYLRFKFTKLSANGCFQCSRYAAILQKSFFKIKLYFSRSKAMFNWNKKFPFVHYFHKGKSSISYRSAIRKEIRWKSLKIAVIEGW